MKIRRLSDFPPLPTSELEKKANDWTEVLSRVIPYENLYECYLIAADKHKEGPFHHGKLLAAWDEKKAVTPAQQTDCLFCPGMNRNGTTVIGPCPFHQVKEVIH